MSLTAQIEIPAAHSPFILARVLALGGMIWTGITAIACFRQSVGGEAAWHGLVPCILLATVAGLWILRFARHQDGGLKLHIQEDGRVLLIQAGMAASAATTYRVAPGSMVWPGLCILRLQVDGPAEGNPGRRKDIVFMRQGAASSAEWPVARLLHWMLRKGGAGHDADI